LDYRSLERAVTRYAPGAANVILSPGSANMFRRSALDLTRPPQPVTGEHLYFDGHFMPLCYGLVGAAFITWPLSTYRLLGGNVALGTALLPGLNPFKPHEDQWRKVRFAECSATVLHDAERLVVLIGPRRYWSLLESVSRRGGRRVDDPVLREPFEKRYATLVGAFGNIATLRGLLGIFTPSAVRRIAAAGKGRRLDPAEVLLISALDLVGRVGSGSATLRRRVRDYLIRRT
jgi:hypothetical protein